MVEQRVHNHPFFVKKAFVVDEAESGRPNLTRIRFGSINLPLHSQACIHTHTRARTHKHERACVCARAHTHEREHAHERARTHRRACLAACNAAVLTQRSFLRRQWHVKGQGKGGSTILAMITLNPKP